MRRSAHDGLVDRYLATLAANGVQMDRAQLDDSIARTIAYCFIYPIAACGQIEVTAPRMVELCQGMADRAVAAIEDVNALALLPS